MSAAFQLQLGGAGEHLRAKLVGQLPWQAVLNGAVGQSLHDHGGEGRAAAGQSAAHRELVRVQRHHQAGTAQQLGQLLLFRREQAAFLLADIDALADSYRCVGNGSPVAAAGEQALQIVKEFAGGNGKDRFARKAVGDRGENLLQQIGFDGDDGVAALFQHLLWGGQGSHAVASGIAAEFIIVLGAGTDVVCCHRAGAQQALHHGLCHVAKADKAESFHKKTS